MTCAMRSSCSRDRVVQRRVAVAVHRAPPGRHPVDQLAAIGERSRTPLADATGSGGAVAGIGLYGCQTWRASSCASVTWSLGAIAESA